MNVDALRQNWALLAALILFLPALVLAVRALLERSASGQLHAAVRRMKKARRKLRKQQAQRARRERRVSTLEQKASRVKPRVLDEAREALTDASAMLKILDDQVLIAENHVRKVIHREYTPEHQSRLRAKYLPNDREDAKPFSF